MRRPIPILFLLAIAAPGDAQAADLPAPIEAFAGEQAAVCSAAGGAPRVGPAFATAVDLNGDGAVDYVVDLAGVECANAWSAFCGPEGCPLSVWISGPAGPTRAWDGVAEGWRLEGGETDAFVVVDRRGAGCAVTAPGAEVCSERLAFDPPPPAPAPEPAPVAEEAARAAALAPLEAPGGEGWTLRAVPGAAPVAVSDGPGVFNSVAVFCLAGQPWLAASLDDAAVGVEAEIGFAFADSTPVFPARREDGAGGALVIELGDRPLAGLLAGRDSSVRLSLDGADQGVMSLRGSTRAIRGALETCAPG